MRSLEEGLTHGFCCAAILMIYLIVPVLVIIGAAHLILLLG